MLRKAALKSVFLAVFLSVFWGRRGEGPPGERIEKPGVQKLYAGKTLERAGATPPFWAALRPRPSGLRGSLPPSRVLRNAVRPYCPRHRLLLAQVQPVGVPTTECDTSNSAADAAEASSRKKVIQRVISRAAPVCAPQGGHEVRPYKCLSNQAAIFCFMSSV